MRLLIVEPMYGLANRTRVIMSALAVAEANDAAVEILWRRNRDLNCHFASLFRQPARVRFVHDRAMHASVAKYRRLLRLGLAKLRANNRGAVYLGNAESLRNLNQLRDQPWIKAADTLWVSTFHPFGKGWGDPRWLRPLEHIEDRAAITAAQFGERCVGVHIRGTDHITQPKQTLPRFIAQMEQELAAHPNTRFFLSTDELWCQDELMRRFPDRILAYTKRSLHRNEPQAIEDALTDMICLSRTQKLLGSFKSSFSIVSAAIGQIECQIIE